MIDTRRWSRLRDGIADAVSGFLRPPGEADEELADHAAVLRVIKAELVELARAAVRLGAPGTVLGHLHQARQCLERAALDVDDRVLWRRLEANGESPP